MKKLWAILLLFLTWEGYSQERTVAYTTSQVVTNVTTGDNHEGCATCEMLRKGFLNGMVPAIYHPFHNVGTWKDADRRWVITNVVKVVTFKIEYEGHCYVFTKEMLVSSTTNSFVLKVNWVAE